jgi:hypothetical protein
VTIDVPHEEGRAVRLNSHEVYLPHRITIGGKSWRQFRLSPVAEEGAPCGDVESFLVRVETDAPIAVYASVIDRRSGDPRTVSPVSLAGPSHSRPLER